MFVAVFVCFVVDRCVLVVVRALRAACCLLVVMCCSLFGVCCVDWCSLVVGG